MTLSWHSAEGLGQVGVPSGSRWQLDELAAEVREYFEHGATVAAGDVVFDVGANIGAFAIEAARRAPRLRLHAFEPVPPLFAALEANSRANPSLRGASCTLAAVAVGDSEPGATVELSYFTRFPTDSTSEMEDKRLDFERFFDHQSRRIAGNFVPERMASVAGRLAARITAAPFGRWLSDQVTGRTAFRCPSVTLSEVIAEREIERVDLLKVDVEGAELRVLEGVAPEHWPRIRQVVLEGHDHGGRTRDVIELLCSAGFDTPTVTHPAFAERSGLDSFLLLATR